jgi:hypothetical protein
LKKGRARISERKRGTGFTNLKGSALALFLAISITAIPYFRFLWIPWFTRGEIRVLSWFPGGMITSLIWQLVKGKVTDQEVVWTRSFEVTAQLCNVVFYTMIFHISYLALSKLARLPRTKDGPAITARNGEK